MKIKRGTITLELEVQDLIDFFIHHWEMDDQNVIDILEEYHNERLPSWREVTSITPTKETVVITFNEDNTPDE